jgi:hypothetical protein
MVFIFVVRIVADPTSNQKRQGQVCDDNARLRLLSLTNRRFLSSQREEPPIIIAKASHPHQTKPNQIKERQQRYDQRLAKIETPSLPFVLFCPYTRSSPFEKKKL